MRAAGMVNDHPLLVADTNSIPDRENWKDGLAVPGFKGGLINGGMRLPAFAPSQAR